MRATLLTALAAALLLSLAAAADPAAGAAATAPLGDANAEPNLIRDADTTAAAEADDAQSDTDLPAEISDREFDASLTPATRPTAKARRYRQSYRKVWVIFAAVDRAACYVGTQARARVAGRRGVARKYLGNLKVGTIISLDARSAGTRGALVASLIIKKAFVHRGRLRYRTYRLSTGRFPFRMRGAFRSPALNRYVRTRNNFSCRWRKARPVFVPRARRAPFPFKRYRAAYVWARGASRRGRVFLRFVVGGERCRRPPNNNGLPARCPCRKSTNPNKGACLEYVGAPPRGRRARPCKPRVCEPRYECVPRRRATARCIRKYGYFVIQKLRRKFRGQHLCRNRRLPRPSAFMAPYA